MKSKLGTILCLGLMLAVLMGGSARADTESMVSIPDELATELRVKTAYNGEDILWRFEWPAAVGHFYHDLFAFQGGEWVRYGRSGVGADPYGFYEDRLTFLVDPGTVRGFANQGCYVTCHVGSRFLMDQISTPTIQEHPFLGGVQNRSDLRKYIPDSREGTAWYQAPWDDIKPQDTLDALREAGVFLDFWHWRSHRSDPMGFADDQYVLEYRNNDGGRTAFGTNWDGDLGQPLVMFDQDKVGFTALRWDDLINKNVTHSDVFYISTENSVPFDPDYAWQEGDVIPRRLLRMPEGGHADISSESEWANGMWSLELRRSMAEVDPLSDHALVEGRTYNVGFAVHKDASGSRWHYISHPQTVGIGTPADISSARFEGENPDWDSIPWTTLPMFYPGQTTWQWLTGDGHPGAPEVRADSRSCADCHGAGADAVLKLAQASVHHETASGGPVTNWWFTLLAGMAVLIGGTVFVVTQSNRGAAGSSRSQTTKEK